MFVVSNSGNLNSEDDLLDYIHAIPEGRIVLMATHQKKMNCRRECQKAMTLIHGATLQKFGKNIISSFQNRKC